MKTVFLPRLSLRARFALGLGAVLLPFLLAAAVGRFYLLPALVEPTKNIVRGFTEEMMPTVHLQLALHAAAMPVNDYLIHADPAERKQFAQLRQSVDRAFDKIRAAPFGLAQGRVLAESAEQEWRKARELGEALLKFRQPVGNLQAARAMERFDARLDRAVALLGEIHDLTHREIDEARAAARAARTQSLWVAFGAFVLALAVSLFAGALLARSILVPLQKLEGAAVRFGAGDLSHRIRPATDDDLGRLGQTFDAMAEALAQDRAALESRAARLGALNRVAVALTSSLQLQELLDEIMRRGVALTDAKAACIAFYDEAAGRFKEWITHGLSEHFVKNMAFRPGGLADETFTAGTYVLSNDWPETRHKLSKLAYEESLKCFICLPLTSHDRRLGVVYFYRTDRDTFTPGEIELLATFAALAAGAIENARLYARTQEQARTDALTGLDNRHEFRRRLDEEIERARRHDHSVSLLMLDLDRFKQINDTYGHLAGDEALCAVAARIRIEIRPTDRAARYGGEEFVVILPETPAEGARVAAERVRRALNDAPIRLADGRAIGLTVSIGVACYPDDAGDPQEIVERADQALYVAKEAGRNSVVLYQETLKAQIEKDPARMVALLNESLDNVGPLLTALSSKAAFFRGHTDAVERAAARLAVALKLPAADAVALALAARLHDIGMAAIPDAVLAKTGELEPGEWAQIRRHPVIAAGWLEQVPALKHLAPIVRHHHERWDGGGYPDGLRGEAIPLLARVLAVADAYSAMSADWPGRKARGAHEVKEDLRAGAGTQFDPRIVAAALGALDGTEAAARRGS